MPAIKTISGGAPEDWNERDKSSFDQFIVNIVKGKLLTISEVGYFELLAEKNGSHTFVA